ncbi:MAG: TIGR02099 family protein [Candidatus Protistobacter heckmanni]|nr:TIGR02099 family protein [Candidatus Protistobacter heckmanni]
MRGRRWLLRGSVGLLLLCATAIHITWPRLAQNKAWLEDLASRQLGASLSIAELETGWDGLQPVFHARNISLRAGQQAPRLTIGSLDGGLSWRTLFWLAPRLNWLRIKQSDMQLERDAKGVIRLAGIQLNRHPGEDADLPEWLMEADYAMISGLKLSWRDAVTGAPPLAVEVADLSLSRDGYAHVARLEAQSPQLSCALHLEADFQHSLLSRPGHWRGWSGEARWRLPGADLKALNAYLPFAAKVGAGRLSSVGQLRFAGGAVSRGQTAFQLETQGLKLGKELPALPLRHAQGQVDLSVEKELLTITVSDMAWQSDAGSHTLRKLTLGWLPGAVQPKAAGAAGSAKATAPATPAAADAAAGADEEIATPRKASLAAPMIELEPLAGIAAALPLGKGVRGWLQSAGLSGDIEDFKASWEAPASGLSLSRLMDLLHAGKLIGNRSAGAQRPHFRLQATLRGVGMAAGKGARPGHPALPGFTRLSGKLDADQDHGTLALDATGVTLALPGLFDPQDLRFDTLRGDVLWSLSGEAIQVSSKKLELANKDVEAVLSGSYGHAGGKGSGTLELKGQFPRVAASQAWRYLPATLNKHAQQYLADALVGGNANGLKLDFSGEIDHFPFATPSTGRFRITAPLSRVSFKILTGPGRPWPVIDNIDGQLEFDEHAMHIDLNHGEALGAGKANTVVIDHAKGRIADLYLRTAALELDVGAHGPTEGFLRFMHATPLDGSLQKPQVADIHVQGQGKLALKLKVPLNDGHSKIDGSFTVANNSVAVTPDLPPFTSVRGEIHFTDNTFELRGRLLGGDIRASGRGLADGTAQISFNGNMPVAGLRQALPGSALERAALKLEGGAGYLGVVRVRKTGVEAVVQSDLRGLGSSFPAPLEKSAPNLLPARLEWRQPSGSRREEILLQLGGLLNARYELERGPDGLRALSGGIGVNQPTPDEEYGVRANVAIDMLDVDGWRTAIADAMGKDEEAAPNASSAPGVRRPVSLGESLLPTSIALNAGEFRLFNRMLHKVVAGISRNNNNWQANVESPQVSGYLRWRPVGRSIPFGELTARLARLNIPQAADEDLSNVVATGSGEIPSIDLEAEEFNLNGMPLGKLEVKARSIIRDGEPEWELSDLRISQRAATLSASGNWRVPRSLGGKESKRTALTFKLTLADAGELINHLGMPKTLSGGYGKLEGRLQWQGSPLLIDYSTVGGLLALELNKGMLLKVDPGIAKLLGVLSFQGLTRLAIFDLKGLAAQGTAFDSVSATANIENGLAQTNDFIMLTPYATLKMTGKADIPRETQDLTVEVLPNINAGSASIAYAVVNPVLGIGTLLAQLVFGDSLGQAFRQEYTITGSWADPQIQHTKSQPADAKNEAGKK